MAGPKHPAARQFIERLMAAAGVSSVPEFARVTGQPERYVYRWRSGEYTPDFVNTVEMLERLGLLNWAEPAPVRRIEPPDSRLESLSARLEELAAAVDDLLQGQTDVLALLRERVAQTERQLESPEGAPKQNRSR